MRSRTGRHGVNATRHRTAHPARPIGTCRHVADIYQFDVENQIGLRRNSRVSSVRTGAAACPICQLPGDEQAPLAANLHTAKSLIEARDQAKRKQTFELLGELLQ